MELYFLSRFGGWEVVSRHKIVGLLDFKVGISAHIVWITKSICRDMLCSPVMFGSVSHLFLLSSQNHIFTSNLTSNQAFVLAAEGKGTPDTIACRVVCKKKKKTEWDYIGQETKGIIERLIHFFGESFAAPSLKYLSERECQRCYRLSIKFRDFCNIELAKLSKNKNKVSWHKISGLPDFNFF